MSSKERCTSVDGLGLPEIRFKEAIEASLGPIDFQPVADGLIHRFHVPGDKHGSKAGWYVLFGDGIASGAFGSWKIGGSQVWTGCQQINYQESENIRLRIEQARQERIIAQQQHQQAAAACAQRLMSKARLPDTDYPYLISKGIKPYNIRQLGNQLLVPLYKSGSLINLQRIYPDGNKRFLRGGIVSGACAYLGIISPSKEIYLCEGWATGATLHEHTGAAVVCAMNANNLLKVGYELQRQHPDAILIVAGDDDRLTLGNPGRTAANHAAATLGCGLVFPTWSGDEPPELSDFNDLANWRAAQ